MPRVTAEQYEETDRRIAIALGVGMPIDRAADYLGISPTTIYNHLDSPSRAFIDTLKSEIEAAIAVKGARIAEKANKTIETRIKDLLDRSFTLTEKAIEKAEALGDDATLPQLIEIHENFTKWATKFVTSEAPKRLALEGQVDHVHTHQISGALMARLDRLEAERRPAITGEVIDV